MSNLEEQSARICELAGWKFDRTSEGVLKNPTLWNSCKTPTKEMGRTCEIPNFFAKRCDKDYDERALDILNLAAVELCGCHDQAYVAYTQTLESWANEITGVHPYDAPAHIRAEAIMEELKETQ